jgi:hypothetical protein
MRNVRIKIIVGLVLLYPGIAFKVFEWRNPLANRMAFWRDFGAVMRFEKLAVYQLKDDRP